MIFALIFKLKIFRRRWEICSIYPYFAYHPCSFFLPVVSRFLILSFHFCLKKLPLASFLGEIFWRQILLVFPHWRVFWFPFHFWRIFLLGIRCWVTVPSCCAHFFCLLWFLIGSSLSFELFFPYRYSIIFLWLILGYFLCFHLNYGVSWCGFP